MNLYLIYITSFIIQFIIAMEMNFIGPLAPFLSNYFGIKGSSVAFFNIGYSIVGLLVPFMGAWSDKYGTKKMIKFSLLLFMIGCIISGLSTKALQFAIGRIFIGLGYFSLSGNIMSYISEFTRYEHRGRASGIFRTAFGIAICTSPLYTAFLTERYNSLLPVYLPLAIISLIAIALMSKLPETQTNDEVFDLLDYLSILKNPRALKVFLALFLMVTGPTLFYNFLSVHLSENLALAQNKIGIIYSIVAIGSIMGILFATFFADKLGKLTFSRIMLAIMALSLAPIPYISSTFTITLLASGFALGLDGGWTSFQAFASEISPNKRATMLSLFYATNAIALTFYSIVGPIFYEFGGLRLTTAIGTIAITLAIIVLIRLGRSPA